MSDAKKIEQFLEEVERKGLSSYFSKISEIASDELDSFLEDIIEDALREEDRPVCRIRYQFADGGPERYIFETRGSDEDEWSFMCSFEVKDDNMIHYTVLTQIRELIRTGYEVCFK